MDCFEESKKIIKQFEETLERFSKTLQKNDLANKIDITLKKPAEYNLKDVLTIAEKVCERHKTAEDVKSCTGAIRKCFRFVGKNSSPLQCLLNFVPSDSYGSAISGGFTVILAVSLSPPIRDDADIFNRTIRLPNESSPCAKTSMLPLSKYPRSSASSKR